MDNVSPQTKNLPIDLEPTTRDQHIAVLADAGIRTKDIAKTMNLHPDHVSKIKTKTRKWLLFKPTELKRAAKNTVKIATGKPVKQVREKGELKLDDAGKPLLVEATIDQQLKAQRMMYEVEVPKKQIHEHTGAVAIAVVSLNKYKSDPIDVQPESEENG